jgi:hypothetical protein
MSAGKPFSLVKIGNRIVELVYKTYIAEQCFQTWSTYTKDLYAWVYNLS